MTRKITPEMINSALTATNFAAVDAIKDDEIERQTVADPDVAPEILPSNKAELIERDDITLNAEEWSRLHEFLLTPPEPNEKLKNAFALHERVVVASASGASPTLSKAVVRAAELLNFDQAALVDIIGISPDRVSHLCAGGYLLDPSRKQEWEASLLFVRMFQSLESILGHGEQAKRWLESENSALNGRPAELVRTAAGLAQVIQYLDTHRVRN